MSQPRVTIVVVPRERFSQTQRALETLYAVGGEFSLVYVDGGSPPRVRRFLEKMSREKGFQLIRRDGYLSPNQARNIGFAKVQTEYAVFIDNDVLVTPGWLQRLVRCADESGAWVVGPLYLMGPLEKACVHMAGGTVDIKEQDGARLLYEEHHYPHTPVGKIPTPLIRRAVDLVEFHCMLVRTAALRRLGALDEQLLSAPEHIDVCLAVRAAGGGVYLEPDAVVSYLPPPPFTWHDLLFFEVRWSDAWNKASLEHFNQKWGVRIQPEYWTWLTTHRRSAIEPLSRAIHRVFGWRRGNWVEDNLVYPLESRINRMLVRRFWNMPAAGGPDRPASLPALEPELRKGDS
jgi:GT2 family glycosyltransferase